jgi:hypothetical protein
MNFFPKTFQIPRVALDTLGDRIRSSKDSRKPPRDLVLDNATEIGAHTWTSLAGTMLLRARCRPQAMPEIAGNQESDVRKVG